jgi:NhaP-type Na+/H+ or K+/H+ antiporter
MALAVILTRAGLGLDLNVLMKLKALIIRFAILPTVLEATIIAVVAHFILEFPWEWGFLLG